jgi:monoterpene epsilon-lactone hydrolase
LLRMTLKRQLAANRGFPAQRAAVRWWGRLGGLPRGVAVERLRIAKCKCERLIPTGLADNQPPILLLHGGAYCWGGLDSHRGLAARIALAASRPVIVLDYRRAPEHVYPAAVDDAEAVFAELVAQSAGGGISLVGDSAGGGLALVLAQRLKSRGSPVPDRIALLSPWVDLTLSGASISQCAAVERMLSAETLRVCASAYAGSTPLDDPGCSPLFGGLAGLPPLLVLVGGEEILRDDALRLAEQVRATGGQVECELHPGLWHVWPLFARVVPEGRAAIEGIGRFLATVG